MMAVPPSPQERRDSQRRTIRLPVRFLMPDGSSARGRSVDISPDGAFIQTAHLMPLGALVDLEITFEDQVRVQRARVVRIFSVPFGEEGAPVTGIGVRFL